MPLLRRPCLIVLVALLIPVQMESMVQLVSILAFAMLVISVRDQHPVLFVQPIVTRRPLETLLLVLLVLLTQLPKVLLALLLQMRVNVLLDIQVRARHLVPFVQSTLIRRRLVMLVLVLLVLRVHLLKVFRERLHPTLVLVMLVISERVLLHVPFAQSTRLKQSLVMPLLVAHVRRLLLLKAQLVLLLRHRVSATQVTLERDRLPVPFARSTLIKLLLEMPLLAHLVLPIV